MKKRKTSFIKTVATVCAAVLLFCVLYLPCGFVFAENSESGEVSVTFVDALNNNTVTVKGAEGELLKFPSDPVDQNNKQWFLGWYTDETYTTEYTADKFGNGDITLYAYWKSEIPGLTQDFENYDKEKYEVDASSGKKLKNNRLYFGDMFSKVSNETYQNSGYSIKLDWDSTMVKDPNDENTYDTSNRYAQNDMKLWLGRGLDNNERYIATIHYKVEKADTTFRFIMGSAAETNIWTGMVLYGDDSKYNIKHDPADTGWLTATVDFTTNFNGNYNYMYLLLKFSSNADVVMYIDSIEIKAYQQPYESVVVVHPNNNENDIVLNGKIGDEITLPTLTNKNGAEFLGYFADEKFEEEFSKTKFERNTIEVYAKWSNPPINFRVYPYDTNETGIFGCTFKIKNEEKVGFNDDYALHFRFIGDEVYSYNADGSVHYYIYQRAKQPTNVAKLTTVNQGSVYLITYYYKQISSNADVELKFITANSGNVWGTDSMTVYEGTTVKVAAGTDGDWVKETVIFTTDLKDPVDKNNGLFLRAYVNNASMETKCNIYIDDISVQEVTDDLIIFNGNDEGVGNQYVIGKAGETLEYPEIVNGRKEFLGWFTDKECTVEFKETTMPKGYLEVYAKWGAGPITFDNYPFETSNTGIFGCTFKINNGKNVGIDDDYTLQFDFNGSDVYSYNPDGSVKYYIYQRAKERTNVAKLATAKSDTLYKVTYNYKQVSSNSDVNIFLATGHPTNVWGGGYVEYSSSSVTVPKGKNGQWQKAVVYFKTGTLETNTNGMYLRINVDIANTETNCDVLIDNVIIEEISAPYVFFEPENGELAILVKGEAGEKITFPKAPVNFTKNFSGWFTDKECTNEFKETVFTENMATTLYAGYVRASKFTYDFENYTIPYKGESGSLNLRQDSQIVKTSKAYSGNTVIEYDRTGEFNTGGSYHAVANKSDLLRIGKDEMYVITVKCCIKKASTADFRISVSIGHFQNFWANPIYSDEISIKNNSTKVGEWKTVTLVIDGSKITAENSDAIFVRVRGGDGGVLWTDDVTVNVVPKGQVAVVVDNAECSKIPNVIIGKKGANFASKLPKNPELPNKYFKGYFVFAADGTYQKLEEADMKFGTEPMTIYARFLELKVEQSFEENYVESAKAFDTLTIYDFDYEVYDASAEGNSTDNVTKGNYSLHRKGESLYLENAIVLNLSNPIAESERYTVSFDVKLGKHRHTEGAVKIVSSNQFCYPWATRGDYYSVAPIADLADGQWHRVSYTFNSVEAFVSIQTPGYVELFIDNVVFELVDDKTPLSVEPTYTEYVQRRMDENCNDLEQKAKEFDITTVIDKSLEKNNNLLVFALIGAGVIVMGAVVLFFVLKKKKAKI